MTDPTTPGTALRERLMEALHGIEDICVRYTNGGCRHLKYADALIAALADDAPRLEAALAPGAVITTVEDVARRLGTGPGWSERVAEARRLLGLPPDGGR